MNVIKPATKSDLDNAIKGLQKSTKSDLRKESKLLHSEIFRVEIKVENIQDEIKDLKSDNINLDSKLDKLQNTLDGFVGRVDDLSIDNEVGTHQTRELQIKVTDLEDRVERLETSKKSS